MGLVASTQIGKNGVTENFIETLKTYFKRHDTVKINVLKSSGRNKKDVKEVSEKILEKLGKNYSARIIGFTIAVKKWRRARE